MIFSLSSSLQPSDIPGDDLDSFNIDPLTLDCDVTCLLPIFPSITVPTIIDITANVPGEKYQIFLNVLQPSVWFNHNS